MNKKYFGSITVRMPIEMIEDLDSQCGPTLSFRDRSEAIREKILEANQFEALLEIAKDPEKQKDLQNKFELLIKSENREKIIESSNLQELDGMLAMIAAVRPKKVQQLLNSVK